MKTFSDLTNFLGFTDAQTMVLLGETRSRVRDWRTGRQDVPEPVMTCLKAVVAAVTVYDETKKNESVNIPLTL